MSSTQFTIPMLEDADFDPENSFIIKQIIARVAHFTNRQQLVGMYVGFVPAGVNVLLRAKVEVVVNEYAVLNVRVPFTHIDTNLWGGGVVHPSIFEPK